MKEVSTFSESGSQSWTESAQDCNQGVKMEKREKKDIENSAASSQETLNVSSKNDEEKNESGKKFTKDDINHILTMLGLTFLFCARGGDVPGAVLATLRQVFVSVFYGFGTTFLFIGLTKKTFKYDPTRVQIVRWAMGLALFFAVSQFLHEGFLLYTGQMPPQP